MKPGQFRDGTLARVGAARTRVRRAAADELGDNLTLVGAIRRTGWVALGTAWRAMTGKRFLKWVLGAAEKVAEHREELCTDGEANRVADKNATATAKPNPAG